MPAGLKTEEVIFAGGCFWCTEAIFKSVKGVTAVISGYADGSITNGGLAEAVKVSYDPKIISYSELLLIFFKTHNPTLADINRTGVGGKYRSAIFYTNTQQRQQAEAMLIQLRTEGIFDKPILTTLMPIGVFHEAAERHQNYYHKNSNKPYCTLIIQPKLDKFTQVFPDLMHTAASE